MAIVIKNNNTANAVPTAAQLVVGELALNTADAVLYTKHTDGSVKELTPKLLPVSRGGTGNTQGAATKLATPVTINGVSFDGSANITVPASASSGLFWENNQAITSSVTLTTGKNYGTFGPITINDGVVVTVGDGAVWTIV